MLDIAYVRKMARYNRWQNANLYGCAARLTEEERCQEHGAFFGSIQKTLLHLIWADAMWLSRFTTAPKPQASAREAIAAIVPWNDLVRSRDHMDSQIENWAEALDPSWLAGDLTWVSGITGREFVKPKWVLVAHMFNHQTHHRGQVHCMLTQAGVKPDHTDLSLMPE